MPWFTYREKKNRTFNEKNKKLTTFHQHERSE